MGCLPSTVGRNTRQRPGAVQRQTRKISGSHRRWTLCVGDYRFPLRGLSQILQAVQRRGNQTHQEGDRPPSQRMERNEAHNGRDQQRSSDARHRTPMLHAGGSSEPTSSIRLPRMLPLPRRSLTYYDPKFTAKYTIMTILLFLRNIRKDLRYVAAATRSSIIQIS